MSDNPPAFPQQCADALDVGMVHEGMTLRDYFAGQALANPTICTGTAHKWDIDRWFGTTRTGIMCHEVAARQALDYADAVLAARALPQ